MTTRALLLGCLLLAVAAVAPAGAQGDKALDVKEIMGKANKPGGLYFNLARELKEADPDWNDVRQWSKDLSQLVGALAKTEPPMGDKAAWGKAVKAYAEQAAALDAAARKKDRKAALTAHQRMEPMCKSCHAAFRKE
jgi:hypothetical protein